LGIEPAQLELDGGSGGSAGADASEDASDAGLAGDTGKDGAAGNGGADAGDGAPVDAGPVPVLPGPSRGSPLALSPDDSLALVPHRDLGTVSVLALAYGMPPEPPSATRVGGEIDLGQGADAEPWQVAIGPDGDTGYAVLRKAQKVVRIEHLTSTKP